MNRIYRKAFSTSHGKTFYLETFGMNKIISFYFNYLLDFLTLFLGCQMNVSDSEIVTKVLYDAGLRKTDLVDDADVVLTNTCAVRENAESKVWQRLKYFNSVRKKRSIQNKNGTPMTIGVLGDI